MRKIMAEFLEIGEKSYYVWKNKSHKQLINFIEKYFTEEDLREFLETGEIGFLEERKVNENGGVISKIYLEMEQMKNKISELERTCNIVQDTRLAKDILGMREYSEKTGRKLGNCLTCRYSLQEEQDTGISCKRFSNLRYTTFVEPDFYCGHFEAKR